MAQRHHHRRDGFCRGGFAGFVRPALHAPFSAPRKIQFLRFRFQYQQWPAARAAAFPLVRNGAGASGCGHTGLPPDMRASTTAPRRRPAPANLPVAPVLSARPIPTPAPAPVRRSDGGAAMGTSSSAAQSGDATALPDGMWIAGVQFPEGGNARVKIGINPCQSRRYYAADSCRYYSERVSGGRTAFSEVRRRAAGFRHRRE